MTPTKPERGEKSLKTKKEPEHTGLSSSSRPGSSSSKDPNADKTNRKNRHRSKSPRSKSPKSRTYQKDFPPLPGKFSDDEMNEYKKIGDKAAGAVQAAHLKFKEHGTLGDPYLSAIYSTPGRISPPMGSNVQEVKSKNVIGEIKGAKVMDEEPDEPKGPKPKLIPNPHDLKGSTIKESSSGEGSDSPLTSEEDDKIKTSQQTEKSVHKEEHRNPQNDDDDGSSRSNTSASVTPPNFIERNAEDYSYLEVARSFESTLAVFKSHNLETKELLEMRETVNTPHELAYWCGARDVVTLMAALYQRRSTEAVDTITSCSLNTNSIVTAFKSDLELMQASLGTPKVDLINILKELKEIKSLINNPNESVSRPGSIITSRDEQKIQPKVKVNQKMSTDDSVKSAVSNITVSLPLVPSWGDLRRYLTGLSYTEEESELITKYIMKGKEDMEKERYEAFIRMLQGVSNKKDLPQRTREGFESYIKASKKGKK